MSETETVYVPVPRKFPDFLTRVVTAADADRFNCTLIGAIRKASARATLQELGFAHGVDVGQLIMDLDETGKIDMMGADLTTHTTLAEMHQMAWQMAAKRRLQRRHLRKRQIDERLGRMS